MEDAVNTICGLVFVVVFLGFLPYGIWVIYTATQKRWKRLAYQVTIPSALIALLLGVSWIVNSQAYDQYLDEIYDTDAKLGKPLFEYDSARAFNGDGYSFSVYQLTETIRTRFKDADHRLLNEYPKRPSYRDHWRFEHWRKTPFDEDYSEYLDFCLSSYDADDKPELEVHFKSMRGALTQEGSFYAFFYNRPSGHLGDVDFFVVDLKGDRVYLINHNT